MERDEIENGEGKQQVPAIKTSRLLKFTCPNCGSHRLNSIKTGSPPPQEVLAVYDDLILLGEPEETDNFDSWYRCRECGFTLGDRSSGALSWKDSSYLVQWLSENCEQSSQPVLVVDQWYEGETAYEEVKVQLKEEGFEPTFMENSSGWQMERWEGLPGQYRLVAMHGQGLYITDRVEDTQWESLCNIVFGSKTPRWTYGSYKIRLVVTDADGFRIYNEGIPYTPVGEREWEAMVNRWLSLRPVQNQPGTKLELIEDMGGTILNSHTVPE